MMLPATVDKTDSFKHITGRSGSDVKCIVKAWYISFCIQSTDRIL